MAQGVHHHSMESADEKSDVIKFTVVAEEVKVKPKPKDSRFHS